MDGQRDRRPSEIDDLLIYWCTRGLLGLAGLVIILFTTNLVPQSDVLGIGLGQITALEPDPLRQGLDTSTLRTPPDHGRADPIPDCLVPFQLSFPGLRSSSS